MGWAAEMGSRGGTWRERTSSVRSEDGDTVAALYAQVNVGEESRVAVAVGDALELNHLLRAAGAGRESEGELLLVHKRLGDVLGSARLEIGEISLLVSDRAVHTRGDGVGVHT